MPCEENIPFISLKEPLLTGGENHTSQKSPILIPGVVRVGMYVVSTFQTSEKGRCKVVPLVMFQSVEATARILVLPPLVTIGVEATSVSMLTERTRFLPSVMI